MKRMIMVGLIMVALIIGGMYIYKSGKLKNTAKNVKETESISDATEGKTNSDWLEYKNEKYKIDMQIPKGWNTADLENNGGRDLWVVFTPSTESGTITQVSLTIGGNNKELASQKELDEWLAKADLAKGEGNVVKLMNNDIGGDKGVTWYNNGEDSDLGKYWLITTWWRRNEKNYYFTSLGKGKDSDFEVQLHLNLLEKISYL